MSSRYTSLSLEIDRGIYESYPRSPKRILITGSSGLIGSRLIAFLCGAGHQVTRLVRRRPLQNGEIFWNPHTGEVPLDPFEGFDAVIHLAGKNIAGGRWNSKFKEELFISRCRDTWLLSHVLMRLKKPPKCFICASAVGIYGNRGEEPLTEESSPGTGFLADLCQKWEEAARAIEQKGVRVVHTRFGMVLSDEGGMLQKLLPVFKLGLGAILGNGQQILSWVALDDVIYAIYHALMVEQISGPLNVTSPHPVTQEVFSKKLANALHRPCFLRLPAPLLKALFGEMADEMLLCSAKALPKKLLQSGFRFQYPLLEFMLN